MQVIYLTDLVAPDKLAGPQSAGVGSFDRDEITCDKITFPSVCRALNHLVEIRGQEVFPALCL